MSHNADRLLSLAMALRDFFSAGCAAELADAVPALCAGRTLGEDEARELEYEFNRLFVGPQAVPAPPFASIYLEKEPQLMVDMIRPLTDLDAPPMEEEKKAKKLFLKLDSRDQKTLRRIDLILQMFEGKDTLVQYFADIKKQRSCSCLVHEAMVKEFKEILGEENVVVK